MSDDNLIIGVEADTHGADADFKKVATSLASVSDAMRELVKNAKSISSAVDKAERSVTGIGSGAKSAKKEVDSLAKSYSGLNSTLAAGSFKRVPDAPAGAPLTSTAIPKDPSVGNLSTTASREAAAATEAARAAVIKLAAAEETATAKLNAHNKAQIALAQAAAAGRDRITAENSAFNNMAAVVEKTSKTHQTMAKDLTNTRYALYSVSNALGITGAAFLAFNGGIVKVAADYQTAMAQISRTSGVSGEQLQQLQGQFIELAQSVPTSFQDLAKIGTLAGQLNIPAAQIADFTKTTAEFSTTTNVQAETAATAFGRLDALLPDVRGNYAALGSSILEVGVNSVATESEIISTSSQIAAAGAQAGLSADQVIGLAASYASLGVASEAARGTTIRVFGLMSKAIASGGDKLKAFADVAGVSSQEFASSWGTPAFTQNFVKFLGGIGEEGPKAQLALAGLGITAARDQNALLKLSQNTGLVTDNLAYAANGFQNANGLAKAFEIQAATLQSKVAELGNTFGTLFQALGSGGLGPLTFFVDVIKDIVAATADFASQPAIQWAASFAGALTALIGIALLVGAALTRIGATAIAARVAFVDLTVASIEAGGGMKGLTAAILGTEAGARLLKGTLASLGVGVVLLAAGAAFDGLNQIAESMKPLSEQAKDTFGNLDGLGEALRKDTDAAKDGAEVFGHIKGTIESTSTSTAAWATDLNNTLDTQVNFGKAVEDTTTSITDQTFAIGENTRAALANLLATNKEVQALFQKNNAAATGGGKAINTTGLLTAAANNDTKGAQKIIDDYRKKYVDGVIVTNQVIGESVAKNQEVANAAQDALNKTTGALQAAAAQQQVVTGVNEAFGVSAKGVADDLSNEQDEAQHAADALKALTDAIASGFSAQNSVAAFAGDFQALVDGIYQGSASFDAFSESGRNNLANLQSAIATSITAGETMGLSASQSVGILFRQLQKQGIDTANLLASIANIPGINVSEVAKTAKGQTALTGNSAALAKVLGDVSNASHKAADALRKKQGGGGGLGGAAAEAAKEIRTLVDYANDLQGVFARAFDLRFGKQDGLDKIKTGWMDIADATEDAKRKIAEAKATLDSLKADKSIQEYFLGVANAFGDSLRAGDIGAKIGEDNNKITAAQKAVKDAQDSMSKSLTGNTRAAIANRETIEGLVKNYEDYIVKLASSGASQAEITRKTREAKAEFLKQATALGFSKTQVNKYARAFDDMGLAVAKIPRKVTINANVNPALTAIREFTEKAKHSAAAGGSSAGRDYASNFTDAVKYNLGKSLKPAVKEAMSRVVIQISGVKGSDGSQVYKTRGSGYLSLKLLKEGGYTGNVPTNQTAGVVHGKEYVINAENTARLGIPFLDALNNGSNAAASAPRGGGGSGLASGPIELGSRTIRALTANGLNVYLDSKQITDSVNARNAKRGTRGQ